MQKLDTLINNVNEQCDLYNKSTMSLNNEDISTRNKQDRIADMLAERFNNWQYRTFYCKVAYALSEAQIMQMCEVADTGRNPSAYFSWLAKSKIDKA